MNVDQILSRAKSKLSKGDIAAARELYQSVLAVYPKNRRAANGLNALAQTPGATHDLPQEHQQAMLALYQQEKLEEAMSLGKSLYVEYADSFMLNFVLGMTLCLLKQYEEAVEKFTKASTLQPNFADVWQHLGNSLQILGKFDEAQKAYEKAVALKPEHTISLIGLANSMTLSGEFAEAIKLYEKVLEADAENASAHCGIGTCYSELENYKLAIQSFEKAAAIDPESVEAVSGLALTYAHAQQFKQAIQYFEKSLGLVAADMTLEKSVLLSEYARVLSRLHQYDEAILKAKQALSVHPECVEAHNSLGTIYNTLNKKKEAIRMFQKGLEMQPDCASIWLNYSMNIKYKPDNPDIARIEALYDDIKDNKTAIKQQIALGFALGKAYSDIGQRQKSFDYLLNANALRKKELGFSLKEQQKMFHITRQIFEDLDDKDWVAREPDADKKFIFVLGMPRSGTSLTEQILSSHSMVYGAGELHYMTEETVELTRMLGLQPEVRLEQKAFKSIGRAYRQHIAALNISEPVVTDKMPHNFLRLGYILACFPDAKIIHMNRDPIAICWSSFKRFFPATGMGYTYDLEELGVYYRMYEEIMDFWRAKFPDRIYELDYDRLTHHQETETRQLLEYCDLPWEDACLNFHKNERPVQTASQTQVREKMYQGSSKAWKAYETQLQPLIKGLAEGEKGRAQGQIFSSVYKASDIKSIAE